MDESGNTTSPAPTEDPGLASPADRLVPALVDVYNKDDPSHVGATSLLHDPAHPAATVFLLGRDGPDPRDAAPSLAWMRQVPGENVPLPPLRGLAIAHDQLRITVVPGGLEIENRGTPKVFIDQQALAKDAKRRIGPGSVIQIRGHSMFLFVMRPLVVTVPGRGLGPLHAFGEADADLIVGEGPVAWRFRAQLAQAALAGGCALIQGESGTGKELAAGGIHRRWGRTGKLVAQNAATIQPTVAELTLFGSRKDWPNKGTPARTGWVFEALEGTLFLDEIGELPDAMQARLLRVLEGWAANMGESLERRVDVRILGGTNRDLSAVLRLDFWRRFVFTVHTPSLAQRIEDITLLARYLVLREGKANPKLVEPFVTTDAAGRQQVQFSPALVLAMLGAHYPGNLRDLRNLLVRAMTEQSEGPLRPPADMTPWTKPSLPEPAAPPDADDLLAGLRGGRQLTQGTIWQALARADGNQSEAAKLLGITRDKLRWWMKKYRIDRPGDD